MPLVIGVAMFLIDPKMMVPFLRSMAGMMCIIGVLCLLSMGMFFIRKIINIDV
jgi:Flp pilus assembly protein TadB